MRTNIAFVILLLVAPGCGLTTPETKSLRGGKKAVSKDNAQNAEAVEQSSGKTTNLEDSDGEPTQDIDGDETGDGDAGSDSGKVNVDGSDNDGSGNTGDMGSGSGSQGNGSGSPTGNQTQTQTQTQNPAPFPPKCGEPSKGLEPVTSSTISFAEHALLKGGVDRSGKTLLLGTRAPIDSTGYGEKVVVRRYEANGALDTTFGLNGSVELDHAGSPEVGHMIQEGPDGKIYVLVRYKLGMNGGNAYEPWFYLVRLNTDGTVDESFQKQPERPKGWAYFSATGFKLYPNYVFRNIISMAIDPRGFVYLFGNAPAANSDSFIVAIAAGGDKAYGRTLRGIAHAMATNASPVDYYEFSYTESDDFAIDMKLDSKCYLTILGETGLFTHYTQFHQLTYIMRFKPAPLNAANLEAEILQLDDQFGSETNPGVVLYYQGTLNEANRNAYDIGTSLAIGADDSIYVTGTRMLIVWPNPSLNLVSADWTVKYSNRGIRDTAFAPASVYQESYPSGLKSGYHKSRLTVTESGEIQQLVQGNGHYTLRRLGPDGTVAASKTGTWQKIATGAMASEFLGLLPSGHQIFFDTMSDSSARTRVERP